MGNYFSTVFQSAKEKARGIKWPQLDTRGSIESMVGKSQSYPDPPISITAASSASNLPGMETDELPLSSQVEDESQNEESDNTELSNKLLSMSEKYDDFKANKEAQLEEWLEGTSNLDKNSNVDYAERI
ncbi:hypothetical protein L6164_008476 [Bauhinia variegata]|nr:hypothetical protein L6164_008476 [Bauhinia variegata]